MSRDKDNKMDVYTGGRLTKGVIETIAPHLKDTALDGRFNAKANATSLAAKLDKTEAADLYPTKADVSVAYAPATGSANYAPATVNGKTPLRKGDLFINALDYGVVADANLSTSTGTDNTTAFATAISAAKTANKTLYVPSGSYRTTDMLDLRGTRVVGDGMGKTTIMCTDNTKGVVLVGGGGVYLADMTLRHFSLPSTSTVPDGVGIRIQKMADRSVIERIQLYNVTSGFYSYEPVGDTTNYIFSSAIRDCRVDRFTHSIMYLRASGAGNTGCVISNIYAQNGNGDGTFGTSIYGYYFGEFGEGVIQQINAEWGFYGSVVTLGECSNLTLQAVHFEQVRAKGSSFNAFFSVFGSSAYSLRIMGVTIKDCIFDQANISDYAIMRLQSQTKVTFDGLVCTGSVVTGTVTRRKFIFSPADAAASVIVNNWRLPDGNFNSADYYATALTIPTTRLANNVTGSAALYEEAGALKYKGTSGTITTLGPA